MTNNAEKGARHTDRWLYYVLVVAAVVLVNVSAALWGPNVTGMVGGACTVLAGTHGYAAGRRGARRAIPIAVGGTDE